MRLLFNRHIALTSTSLNNDYLYYPGDVRGASEPKSRDVTSDETEAGVCAVAAVDAMSAPAHPELA